LSSVTPASTTPSPPTPNTLAASAGAAFDYNIHDNCGSGDRICCHGVMDIFRTPKFAAGFYKSMCEPSEEIVLEPAFHWSRNDESIGFTTAMISSNCDHLKLFVENAKGERLVDDGAPC
jgi:beta-galactosidase